jgi:hypothetical protein
MNATFLGFKWGYIKKLIQLFQIVLHDYQKAFHDIDNIHVLEYNNAITLQSCEMSKTC